MNVKNDASESFIQMENTQILGLTVSEGTYIIHNVTVRDKAGVRQWGTHLLDKTFRNVHCRARTIWIIQVGYRY